MRVLGTFITLVLFIAVLGRCATPTAREGDDTKTAFIRTTTTAKSSTAASHVSQASAIPSTPTKGSAEQVNSPTVSVPSETPTRAATATPRKPTRTPTRKPASTPTKEPTSTSTPIPTATVTATPTPKRQSTYYVVQSGDTLWSISGKFGVTVADIARANGISPNDEIQVGQRLRIPSSGTSTQFVDSTFALPKPRGRLGQPKQQPLRKLAPKLVSYLKHRQGVSAAAVYIPETDTLYAWDGAEKFYTASTVKVPIMVTKLSETYRDNHNASSVDTSLLTPMITVSDNNAATALLAQVGGPPAVNRELRARGIYGTTINPEAWGLSQTTAPDMARLLRSLYYGVGLNASLRDVAFNLMSSVIEAQRWGYPAGLPASANIAFKGGWLGLDDGWLVHQVGIVRQNGRTYIFAIYNKQQPTWDYGKQTLQQSALILNRAIMSNRSIKG